MSRYESVLSISATILAKLRLSRIYDIDCHILHKILGNDVNADYANQKTSRTYLTIPLKQSDGFADGMRSFHPSNQRILNSSWHNEYYFRNQIFITPSCSKGERRQ